MSSRSAVAAKPVVLAAFPGSKSDTTAFAFDGVDALFRRLNGSRP